MGGSSLAPALLTHVFGVADGGTPVRVLDSTDPTAVAATLDDLDPTSTLFIVSTKSGTTAEPLSFQAYQWERIAAALKAAARGPADAARRLHGRDHRSGATSLRSIPHHDELREVFLNPPDVGGRYSALTYVGLVPGRAPRHRSGCAAREGPVDGHGLRHRRPATNPGLALGLAMGVFAANGRDKLTFVIDRELSAFGAWVEQLIAESTGKETLASIAHRTRNEAVKPVRVGVVPVDGEPLGALELRQRSRLRSHRSDRLGRSGSFDRRNVDARLAELAAAGHPVIRIELGSKIELGAEFVRWEVATALAGVVLGIDPFDQPNVEEAKTNTRTVLAAFEEGKTPDVDSTVVGIVDDKSLATALKTHLGKLGRTATSPSRPMWPRLRRATKPSARCA
jgi:transaldolase/glucose-6-phosphate isomerase